MSVLTIRLPDSKHARLKEAARARGLSVNKFMEDLATMALVAQDTQVRLALRASQGDAAKGLHALDALDAALGGAAKMTQ